MVLHDKLRPDVRHHSVHFRAVDLKLPLVDPLRDPIELAMVAIAQSSEDSERALGLPEARGKQPRAVRGGFPLPRGARTSTLSAFFGLLMTF